MTGLTGAARRTLLALGPAVLAPSLALAAREPMTTYAGSAPWAAGLELAAALSLLGLALVVPDDAGRWPLLALAGGGWLLPELAGWSGGPPAVRALADGWARLLPAVVLLGLVPSWRRPPWPVVTTLAGASLAAGSRVLLADPFLDPRCWRWCDHNPLAGSGHPRAAALLEAAGVALLAVGAVAWAARSFRQDGRDALLGRGSGARRAGAAAAATLLVGLIGPAVLRGWRPESSDDGLYVTAFVLAQLGACALSGLALVEHLRRRRIAARIGRQAAALDGARPGDLEEALRAALGDRTLEIRYWSDIREAYVDATGSPVPQAPDDRRRTTRIRRGDRQVACILHAPEVDGDRLDRALGHAHRLALQNQQLRAASLAELGELTSSRARVVERADLERRRLERNLHDGAQQRVVTLALLTRMIADRVPAGPGHDGAVRATELTTAAVDDLRAVARGIYPAVVLGGGLADGLTELALASTDLVVSVDATTLRRHPAPLETIAYTTVAAAVEGARARQASSVAITAEDSRGVLRIVVRDDAATVPDPLPRDLAERLEALGGRGHLTVEGPGHRLTLELPCA